MRATVLFFTLCLAACSGELAHDAPYDPATPAAKQARATLTGSVKLAGETDHSQISVQLRNEAHAYLGQTLANGSVEITGIVPGAYTLTVGTRSFEEKSSELLLAPGETHALAALTLRPKTVPVEGKAFVTDRAGAKHGGVKVTLRKVRSVRGKAGAAPAFAAAAATAPSVVYETTSAGDGGFTVGDVEAGVYTETLSVEGTTGGSTDEIVVSGEDGAVSAGEATVSPMFAFVDILGKSAAGAISSTTVTLRLSSAGGSPTTVQVAFDSDFVTALAPVGLAKTLSVTLPPGDGAKTVYVRTFDAAGNVSTPGSDAAVLDTVPPSSPTLDILETSPTKADPIHLSYAAQGAATVTVTEGAVCGGTPESYTGPSARAWNFVSPAEGLKSIAVRFYDDAGNASACVVKSIYYDPNGPAAGTLTLDGGAALTNNPLATLAITHAGATQMLLANNAGFSGAAWQPVTTATLWALSPGDGLKTVFLKFRDDAGNESAPLSNTITLDQTPPTGASFSILAGSSVTSTSVLLTLNASGATEVLTGNDSAFAGSAWRPFGSPVTHTLTVGDGLKVVYVKFRDPAGNETAILTQVVTLDTQAPTLPQILVSGGGAYATTDLVQLDMNAIGAVEMAFSNDGLAFSAWEPYLSPRGYQLLGTDGTKTVYVKFRDAAGNTTGIVSDDIVLDRTAPTGLSFEVSGGATTRSAAVTLLFTATGAAKMQISEDGAFATTAWEPFAAARSYTLSPGEGVKTLYARFADDAGHVTATLTKVLTLDTLPPVLQNPPLQINGGALYAKSEAVSLTLRYVDAVSAAVGEDLAVQFPLKTVTLPGGGAYSFTVTVSAGEGPKNLYAKFWDAAGNTIVQGQGFTLDKTPPGAAAVSIDGGAAYNTAAAGTATLSLSAADVLSGVAALRISNTNTDGDLDGATPVPFTISRSWTLASPGAGQEGLRTVYVKFVDAAGNASPAAITDTIAYDTRPPTAGFWSLAFGGGAYTTSPLVTLAIAVTGASEMQLANDPAFTGAAWERVAAATFWNLPAGDGAKTVYARFRDAAGNASPAYAASITLDTTPPVPGALTLNEGAPVTNSTAVRWQASAAESLALPMEVQVAADASFSGAAWQAYHTSGTLTIPPGDGYRTIYARFRDAVGNVSPLAANALLLDQTPPILSYLQVNGDLAYAGANVPVRFQIGNWAAGDKLQIATNAGFTAASELAANAGANAVTFALAGPDGPKTIYLRAKDTLGNLGAVYAFALTRDTTPPALTGPKAVVLDGDSRYATRPYVAVSLNVSGASEMQLANDPSFAGASWDAFAPGTVWFLAAGDGVRTVYARFRDLAGNTLGDYADAITVDTQTPEAPGLAIQDINGDGHAIASDKIELAWTPPSDPSLAGFTLQQYVAGLDTSFLDLATLSKTATQFSVGVTATTGARHEYRIRAFDAAGNVSAWSVVVGTTPYKPLDMLYWVRGQYATHYEFPAQPGTFMVLPKHEYATNTLFPTNTVLPTNTSVWEKPIDATVRYDERLRFDTLNQDNSLVFSSLFDLNLGVTKTETLPGVGSPFDLRFDGAGALHAVYPDGSSHLRYATNRGGAWSDVLLTPTRTVTLARLFFYAGAAHILYYDSGNTTVRHLAYAAGTWNDEAVSTAGNVAALSAEALGGKIHAAYVNTSGAVHYATNQTGAWVDNAVFTETGTDSWRIHLAINPVTQKPAIFTSAFNFVEDVFGDYNFYYLTLTATWSAELITSISYVEWEYWPRVTAFGMDGAGHPHVAFDNYYSNGVWYFTKDSAWTGTSVGAGFLTGLAVLPGDSVCVLYYDQYIWADHAYCNETGAWSDRVLVPPVATYANASAVGVDDLGFVHAAAQKTSLTSFSFLPERRPMENLPFAGWSYPFVDRRGAAHTVTFDATGVLHGSNENGPWEQTRVATLTNATIGDVFTDKRNHTHVLAAGSGKVMYATNARGTWESAQVDTALSHQPPLQIVSDGAGVHGTFLLWNGSSSLIHYAYAPSVTAALTGGWQVSTVVSGNDYPKALTAAAGAPHVLWQDSSRALYYATKSGASWVSENLDSDVYSEHLSQSIALDASGDPHAAWASSANVTKYAVRKNGVWSTEVIDTIGGTASLCLVGDTVYILYGSGTHNLRLATNQSGAWSIVPIYDGSRVQLGRIFALDGDRIDVTFQQNTDTISYMHWVKNLAGKIPAASVTIK